MGAEVVYLSLGSNVGARDENLNAAIALLPATGAVAGKGTARSDRRARRGGGCGV